VLLRLQEKQQRSELPRRMPCEKNTQVAGTLIPLESRTLHSNQLVNEENNDNKQQSFRKKLLEQYKKEKACFPFWKACLIFDDLLSSSVAAAVT
jgi:hypothetical protein